MSSERIVQVSLIAGLIFSGLSLSLLFGAVMLRVRYGRRERDADETIRRWFPYFLSTAAGERPDPPLGFGDDAVPILTLWLDFMESLGGPMKDRLRAAITLTSLPDEALKIMRSRNLAERVMAIAVAGHLREPRAWDYLLQTMERGGTTALVAARALVQIDPQRGLPLFVTKVRRRIDWPLPTVASILLEASPKYACQILADEIGRAESTREEICQAGLLHLATSVAEVDARPLVSARLNPTRPKVVVLTALKAAAATDADAVRPLIDHSDPEVRAEAARALGRVGVPGDEELLILRLDDDDAWVRYCAAQAISFLPWIELKDMVRMRENASPRARAVLDQAASEAVSAAATLETATADESRLDVKFLREFFEHGNWKIRMLAAERLALAETRTGQQTLQRLLGDERWWTQYEAARRLASRPFAGVSALRRLLDATPDDQSRSVLTIVAQEQAA